MFGRMWDNNDLYEVIVEGWEKSATGQGIPYFINHKSERTCWDHPYFVKILDELGEMDAVKYAAYRTALKLRHLQKRLRLNHVTLHTVSNVFIQYGYQDGLEAVVDCEELSTLLTQMYSQAETGDMGPEDITVNVDLLQNLLLNTYDIKRTGCIRVLSLKLCLACLCKARLSEKYRYFYRQLCDSNFFVGRQMLGTFLLDCLQIPELIHERAAFGGTNVTPAVDSCVHMCGMGPGVSEDSFLAWLLKEPQTLVWLPTMHRVAASESVKHDAKCNVCKACPLMGFRYRCLQCFNFDICQTCFFSGRTGKGHKLKHPIQEYCLPTSSKEDTKAFMKTVRNNLSKKHRRKNKPKYLPIDGAEYNGPDEWSQPEQIPDDLHPVVLKKSSSLASANNPPTQTRSALSPVGQNQTRPANRIAATKSTALPKINNIDKENMTPYTGLSVPEEDRTNLEKMIRNLEEENRHLYKQLAEINTGGENSETESNGSYAEELEEEREVLEAKKEVLEYHNLSLNKQLSRVRHALKTSPSSDSYGFFENSDLTLDVTPFDSHVSGLSPSLPLVSPLSNQSGSTIPISEQTSLEDASPVTIGDLRTPGNDNGPTQSVARHNLSLRGDNSSWTPTHFFSPYLIKSRAKQPESEQKVPNGFTPQLNGDGDFPPGWDSVDLIDGDLGQSPFTLPSVSQSQHFPEEEAELDSLVHQIEKAFPADMSYSAYLGGSRSYGVDRDMLGAANRLGDAMTEFVSATGNHSMPS